jgi:transcriptional regulator with XRE-family HTH domain
MSRTGWNNKQRREIQSAGQKLASVRKQLSRPRQHVADSLGITLQSLEQIELGRRAITEQEGAKLAQLYGYSAKQFNLLIGYKLLPVEAPPPEPELEPVVINLPPPSKDTKINIRHEEKTPMDSNASTPHPAMAPFDLNAFYQAYTTTNNELALIGRLLGELQLAEPGKPITEQIAGALRRQAHQIEFLTKAVAESNQSTRAIETLRTLRELIDQELKATTEPHHVAPVR